LGNFYFMMERISKSKVKDWLGGIPLAAEAYWYLRQPGKPLRESFSLNRLERHLSNWAILAGALRQAAPAGKRIFLFGTLRYWIEHTTLVGMTLSALGHDVTLAYLPYDNWRRPFNRFDLRRQNVYVRNVLSLSNQALTVLPLHDVKKAANLPPELEQAVQENARRDTQYTLQVEEIDRHGELYQLRLKRNGEAARAALACMQANRPDVVILPNGSILEFNAIYHTARYLRVPVVTYEFGEQRGRIWLAKNAEVMRQDTDELWQKRKDQPLNPEQFAQVQKLFSARQRGSLWQNFSRRWQGTPGAGGEEARTILGLDQRPVILMATNVIGDSLTLGRQVFSDSMTEWLERTLRYISLRKDAQFVVRIHPGELITKGPSVAELVRRVLPELPEHVHLVAAGAKVNTYDIVEIADLGLVYTTTVGLEMAMSGVPALVVGCTHYRGKGFTLDPDSWESYFSLLDRVISDPQNYRMSKERVDLAWNYAYRFFFEYPHPFPWHLLRLWNDVDNNPLERVLDRQGQAKYGKTFSYLTGETVEWI
jgi:hypothetical protein